VKQYVHKLDSSLKTSSTNNPRVPLAMKVGFSPYCILQRNNIVHTHTCYRSCKQAVTWRFTKLLMK